VEFAGGPLMVAIVAVLFRLFLSRKLVKQAKEQADKGIKGAMEGHAEMDMSVEGRSFWQRISSPEAITATSHYFVMDWAMVWKDIAGGVLIAGAISAWVPQNFWKTLFFTSHPVAATVWGPIIGPIVAVLSFVCSVGNIPLAAVLWNGGISFGGVIAFIYADLIVLPIINIYRKYYGWKATAFVVIIFYFAMAAAALIIESVFRILGLVPQERKAQVVEASISFNYTTVLNIIFLMVAGFLFIRFLKTGGPKMLAHMD
jgi:uncharacterized membrane protein YraQ (UPF0718 family)